MATGHFPVMLEEAMVALGLRGHETVVDATFGAGGHTLRILESLGPDGKVVGIDRDPDASTRAARIDDECFVFMPGAFDEVLWRLVKEGREADAILFDLGLSSYQIDDTGRGFSYVNDGPLDMRMDTESDLSAADLLNTVEPDDISRMLVDLGDVSRRDARRIAREVVRRRPLERTRDLTDAVRSAVGWVERGGNPSKRVFQAVRMSVNDELGSLGRGLAAAERLLVEGGRLVVITFHSGEDRLVKRFISDREGRCVCPPELPVCVCGARPVVRRGAVRRPSEVEIRESPRSASARMRVALRTSEPPLESEV